jgi:hypothetical protein
MIIVTVKYLKENDDRMWNELNWLRTGKSDGLL